jgi:hypothetical protein
MLAREERLAHLVSGEVPGLPVFQEDQGHAGEVRPWADLGGAVPVGARLTFSRVCRVELVLAGEHLRHSGVFGKRLPVGRVGGDPRRLDRPAPQDALFAWCEVVFRRDWPRSLLCMRPRPRTGTTRRRSSAGRTRLFSRWAVRVWPCWMGWGSRRLFCLLVRFEGAAGAHSHCSGIVPSRRGGRRFYRFCWTCLDSILDA